MADGKAANVQRLGLFGDLDARDVEWVCRVADVVDVPAGTTLAVDGESVREVAVVMDGVASAGDVLLGRGAYFGACELATGRRAAMTVASSTPVRLLVFGVREFRSLLKRVTTLRSRFVADAPQPVEADLMLRAVS